MTECLARLKILAEQLIEYKGVSLSHDRHMDGPAMANGCKLNALAGYSCVLIQ